MNIEPHEISEIIEEAQDKLESLKSNGCSLFDGDRAMLVDAIHSGSVSEYVDSRRYGGGITSDYRIFIVRDGVAFIFDSVVTGDPA